MAIWGVGTGRCGTKSLAYQYGGLHEPEPKIVGWGAHYARGILPGTTLEELKRIIEFRRDMDAALVSDLQHSYIMDLIEKIDPDARFIYLIRNPFDCIASFMLGGAFTDTDWNGANKAQPPRGWEQAPATSRLEKVIYHYTYTNIRIINSLSNNWKKNKVPWAIRYTTDLVAHENNYSRKEMSFTREEAALIFERTSDIWESARRLWDRQEDGWLLEFEARAAKF